MKTFGIILKWCPSPLGQSVIGLELSPQPVSLHGSGAPAQVLMIAVEVPSDVDPSWPLCKNTSSLHGSTGRASISLSHVFKGLSLKAVTFCQVWWRDL